MEGERMIVSVSGGKGGTGKSTVAVNLAVLLSRGYDLVLADLDVEDPNDHILLGVELENEEPVLVFPEGTKGDRKPMWLKLKVKSVSFHEFSNRLRIKGTILEGPEDFVSFGSYHTFNIETGQQVTIQKSEWLKNELKR